MERLLDRQVRDDLPFAIWSGIRNRPGLTILVIGLVLAVLLALPGQTVVTILIEDVFSALDGVQRLAYGQVPSRDFHSAVGPLAYYLPGLGLAVTGSLGAALPLGMAVSVLLVAAILAHILPSRLRPGLAIPFGLFLLLVLAVPMNLGDAITALSFNQYYNRIGWVGLAALLVLQLVPVPQRRQPLLDGFCAAVLTVLLLYTRATYGLVALGFLALLLTDPRQRLSAATALALTLAVAGLVEIVWHGSRGYAQDVLLAFAAGGILRGTPANWLGLFLANFADYILLALIAGLLFWRRFSLRDLVFVLFCGLCGFWLINQNDQRWGILVVHAAAVVLAERLVRDMERYGALPAGPIVNPAGVHLFAFGLLFPTLVHCTAALMLHFGAAIAHTGQSVGLPRLEAVRLADLWTPGEFGGGRWYLDLVAKGLDALTAADRPPGRIVVLGGPNPFSLALDLPPATGDVGQMRWGATHSATYHIAPDAFLGNADTVMERLAAGGSGDLGATYRPYLDNNFRVVAETADWRIFMRETGVSVLAK